VYRLLGAGNLRSAHIAIPRPLLFKAHRPWPGGPMGAAEILVGARLYKPLTEPLRFLNPLCLRWVQAVLRGQVCVKGPGPFSTFSIIALPPPAPFVRHADS
jgi:hypothetical protein